MNRCSGSASYAGFDGARGEKTGAASGARRADPEVFALGRRRQFSSGEKRALLAEADRGEAAGTLGAFMRERHIYSPMLSSWRRQLCAADRVALALKRRGPKAHLAGRPILQLICDLARVQRKCDQTDSIIDAKDSASHWGRRRRTS